MPLRPILYFVIPSAAKNLSETTSRHALLLGDLCDLL
jgi:hypothetical protein